MVSVQRDNSCRQNQLQVSLEQIEMNGIGTIRKKKIVN